MVQSTHTTHRYVAYIAPLSGSAPPAGAVATSSARYLTWASTGFQVDLTLFQLGNNDIEVYATVTDDAGNYRDIGPTPYWIEVFDVASGRLVGSCSRGFDCYVWDQLGSSGGLADIAEGRD